MKHRLGCAVSAIVLFLACRAWAQMTPEEAAQALEEMKQRDAIARADRLERKLAEAQKEIESLRASLASANQQMEQAQNAAQQSQQRVRELEDQLAAHGIVQPAGPGNTSGDPSEVTARQIQITGDRFVGQPVRLTGCVFATAHTNYTQLVPDVERTADGQVRITRRNQPGKWVGLIFTDSTGRHFFHAYAPKEQFGALLQSMPRGTQLDIGGIVAPLLNSPDELSDRYALVCESIQVR